MLKNTCYVLMLFISGLGVMPQNYVCAEFMRGADISTHTRQVADGVIYKEYGIAKDLLVILNHHDFNWIRIRLFHTPSGDLYGVTQDLAYVTNLGAQIKTAGFKFLLDIHYSDTWADPGQQTIPAAWSGLNHSELVTVVQDYTQNVIEHLRLNNAMPDMVQIGNEIVDGMLWPDGRISVNGWGNLADLINAGITGIDIGRGTEPLPEIMIHIDRGGDASTTQWFFDNLISQGVQFDVIGQSFYPEWHGTISDLAACLNMMSNRYSQDIILVEVGEYYTGRSGKSPENQNAFLENVFDQVQVTPNGKGRGVCYWEPAWVWNSGVGYRALFEPEPSWSNVEMLMGMEAFDIGGDEVAPAAPTGLSALADGYAISLTWNDNTEDDLDSYNVYRSQTQGSGYTKMNSMVVEESSYIDNALIDGQTYYYVVTAVDTSSNESYYSNEAFAETPDTGMGTVLCEWWTGINGTTVGDLTSDPNYPESPSDSEHLTRLEGPTGWGDTYGTRIRGYLHPPETGDYSFWIAGDDNCQLWLGMDGTAVNAVMIANVPGWTESREWDKYTEQESSPIFLTAGQKYYIEVLHKEDIGEDNVAVAWSGPGISQEVVDGRYLSPLLTGPYGDFNKSGFVSVEDLAMFADNWIADNCILTSAIDLDGNCIVDFYEFSRLTENWLN